MTQISKVTTKFQTTIPLQIRKVLGIRQGDSVAFEVEDGEVRLRKATAIDIAFADAVSDTLGEWNSQEDDDAYRGL